MNVANILIHFSCKIPGNIIIHIPDHNICSEFFFVVTIPECVIHMFQRVWIVQEFSRRSDMQYAGYAHASLIYVYERNPLSY